MFVFCVGFFVGCVVMTLVISMLVAASDFGTPRQGEGK